MIADSIVDLTKARLAAVARLCAGKVTDEEFLRARHPHLVTYAEYALQQPAANRHYARDSTRPLALLGIT